MKKIYILFLITTIQFQVNAQNTQIYNDLKTVYNYCNTAYDNISKGLSAINYCYSISNERQLRTQVLYACSNPANAKKSIDEAIKQIYMVEQQLYNVQCPMSIKYVKLSKELLVSSRENAILGGLALLSASEQRYTNNIYSQISRGASHLKNSLSDLNKGIDGLNKIIDELNRCSSSSNENSSSSILCNTLIEFMEENGINKKTIYESTLNSSWIKEVSKYEYKDNSYIIASIKETENGYKSNKYIFCAIPDSNWSKFAYSTLGTYGERFNEYIFSYKCECD